MKRIIIFLSFLVCSFCVFALETKKVAILEVVDQENKLSYHQKLMLRSILSQEINKAAGFEAYERANVDAILNEHNFQRTGFVSSDQIRAIGKMAGASYILVTEGAISSSENLFVSTTILDVVTGKIAVSASENMQVTQDGMQKGCASLATKLFNQLKVVSDEYLYEEKRINQEVKDAEEAERAKYYIYKDKKDYKYRGSNMNSQAYAGFLKNNCPEAYKQYKAGKNLKIVGWAFLGVGLATITGGAIHRVIIDSQVKNIKKKCDCWSWSQLEDLKAEEEKYSKISYAIMGVGGGLVLTSIPLVCVGSSKQKRSVSTYNEQCSSPSIPPITFNLTAGQNGLGLALQF